MAEANTAGRKRESILQEATRLFGAQGYAGTTMRDIAGAVGVLPGSLYTHIEGKEQLLLEVVETGIDRFLDLEPLGADHQGSPAQRFRRFITGHVALVAENPEWSRVINHQWRFLIGDRLRTVVTKRRRYEDILDAIVTDGQRTGDFDPAQDIKVVLLVVLGALNWTPEWYNPHGPDSAAEVGERLAETLLTGLATPARHAPGPPVAAQASRPARAARAVGRSRSAEPDIG